MRAFVVGALADRAGRQGIIKSLADQSQRLFFQMVKPDSTTLTRDCAFVVDLVYENIEHISDLGH